MNAWNEYIRKQKATWLKRRIALEAAKTHNRRRHLDEEKTAHLAYTEGDDKGVVAADDDNITTVVP